MFCILEGSVFISQEKIVDITSFSVEKGDIVSITGKNGSGKSSLLNAIFKRSEYELTYSNISIDGISNWKESTTFDIANAGYLLFQQKLPHIAGLQYKNLWEHMAERKGTTVPYDDICAMFPFVTEKMNEVVGAVSGGESKIMEIIPLFFINFRIAFLDEIDGGLDKESKQKLVLLIQELNAKGKSIVIISHDQALLDLLKPNKKYHIENEELLFMPIDEI